MSSDDSDLLAQQVSGLNKKVADLERRTADVEKVNNRLEQAALKTARALQEIAAHWDAVYEAMRRAESADSDQELTQGTATSDRWVVKRYAQVAEQGHAQFLEGLATRRRSTFDASRTSEASPRTASVLEGPTIPWRERLRHGQSASPARARPCRDPVCDHGSLWFEGQS